MHRICLLFLYYGCQGRKGIEGTLVQDGLEWRDKEGIFDGYNIAGR